MRALLLTLTLTACAANPGEPPAGKTDTPDLAVFTRGMQHLPGFVDLYLDADQGRVFLRIDRFGEELLYATAQASGLGANPVGIDRGSLGPQHVVSFRRAGDKVLLLAHNLDFRAETDNARERSAVAESFAPSVLAALPIAAVAPAAAETAAAAVLVDATGFLLRDATGAGDKLESAGQGAYEVDVARSALWPERTRAFPDNTEVEVLLTLTTDAPGPLVRQTAASADAVTLRQHHSFVRLPDTGFRPRRHDPRVGYFGPRFVDYAAPLGDSMDRQWIARHRLQRRDPTADVSDPVEPIVYYIDPGTPEPIRSALREGAMWWAAAFAAAGFRSAFRVELLPADADPMDVRYHMIHWVHRRTRGWSYGASISDPRTGEIIKGNVLLGSLRVRQDHLKFTGLQAPYAAGACATEGPDAGHLAFGDDALARETALARIRQLAAHEVGHTLGLSHNFAASTYGRASVMDYPAPLVGIEGGELDFSQAYATGVGAYDVWAIRYGYTQFAAGVDEDRALDALVQEGLKAGYVFLTDQDARAEGTGHPLASLWDNGSDPVAQLEHELAVRAIGLRRFGIGALRPGAALAGLEDALVPLYLHHRFQLEAALKVLGGVDFRHAIKGDGQVPVTAVDAAAQRRALQVVLSTLRPEVLQLDPRLLALLPPAPPGHPATAERFPRSTGQLLDPIALATVAADLTISGLLHPQRAARLAHRDAGQGLAFADVLQGLVETVGYQPTTPVGRAVQALLVDRLMDLANDARAGAVVRDATEASLQSFVDAAGVSPNLRRRIETFLADPDREVRRTPGFEAPPGSPIGQGAGG